MHPNYIVESELLTHWVKARVHTDQKRSFSEYFQIKPSLFFVARSHN